MNNYDLLLHWLSARPKGEASTPVITDACIALAQRDGVWQSEERPSYWRYFFFDTLYRLGHVEPAGRAKWAIVPPVLLWVSGLSQAGEAHLYGARTATLWKRLQQDFGSQISAISQPNGPALWKFVGTRSAAQTLAQAFNTELHEERGVALLASLPNLQTAARQFRSWNLPDPREGWEFFQVQCSPNHGVLGQWTSMPTSQPIVAGVYRRVRPQPPVWVHVSPNLDSPNLQARLLDDRNPEHNLVARWVELARSGQLRLKYDKAARTLAVPDVNVSLPVLVDRALRLASGRCPEVNAALPQRYRVFTNITPDRVRQARRVLGLHVEIAHG